MTEPTTEPTTDPTTDPVTEPPTTGTTAPPAARRRPVWLGPVVVVVAYLVVGLVAGLVWEAIWTPPSQVISQHTVYYADYASLRRVFTGTGLYALVGGIASAATALVVCVTARRRELVTLGAVLVGSVAASLVMWKVGVSRGPTDPDGLVRSVKSGTHVQGNLEVSGHSPFVVWPLLSLFVLALVFFSISGPLFGPRSRESDGAADEPVDPGPERAPGG